MNKHESLCVLPWVGIETTTIGTVRPCCVAVEEITDDNGQPLDLHAVTLEDAYNSKYMQNLRRQFRASERPATCNTCWNQEESGMSSHRQRSARKLANWEAEIDWENDTPDQLWNVDLKLGNICNLKCRICSSKSSSKWAEEEMILAPVDDGNTYVNGIHNAHIRLKQGAWPRKTPVFWDNMHKLLPNIKFIDFSGGEPWLIQEHWDLLKYAMEQGYSKNISIHYNTNATQWPKDALEYWKEFESVHIAFSVDNVGRRFEYERYGSNWTETTDIISTVNNYKTTVPTIATELCSTINIQNIYYLDELLAWADTINFDSVFLNMMHDPAHMSLQQLTPNAQQLVIDKLTGFAWKDQYQSEIDGFISFVTNATLSDGKEFVNRMKQSDTYRKQNFQDTHPEIAQAMGYE
jgi:MoaA/NifB/PqqE/SkfB family radical SAM enzyme